MSYVYTSVPKEHLNSKCKFLCFPGYYDVSYLSIRILFGREGMWDPFVSRTPC